MWTPAHPITAAREQAAVGDAPRMGEQMPRGQEPMVAPYKAVSTYIGKSLLIKGEVSGSEPIEVDGRIEGPISLPSSHVDIRRDGVVMSDVQAAEVVIQGTFQGKLVVGDRVKIQRGGSLVGAVTAVRVSVEDGAYLQASIETCRLGPKLAPDPANIAASEQPLNAVDKAEVDFQV